MIFARLLQERPWTLMWAVIEVWLVCRAISELGWP